MKKSIVFIIYLVAIFFFSSCEDDIIITDNGSASITFLEDGTPITDGEVRIVNEFGNISSNFEFNNVFEGITNNDGAITTGELLKGNYSFRLSTGKEFFFDGIQIPDANKRNNVTYDLNLFRSDLSIRFNTQSSGGFSEIETPTGSYYLYNTFLSPAIVDFEQLVNLSPYNTNTTSAGTLDFNNVLRGQYNLAFSSDNQNFTIISFLEVRRDFDEEIDLNIDVRILLRLAPWNISRTEDLFGNILDDDISSINFSTPNGIDQVTFNFTDGATFSTGYAIGISSNRTWIFLDNNFPNTDEVRFINDLVIQNDRLQFDYQDQTFNSFAAYFTQ